MSMSLMKRIRFLVRRQRLTKVQVEILDKNNEQAAVDGAFSWDQKFVLTSSKTLRDGDRVRLLEEQ